MTMFDLGTLSLLGRIPAGDDADAILYDPASTHIFTFNGDAGSSTVIDPSSGKAIGNIALGGKPELGVRASASRHRAGYLHAPGIGALRPLDH
ncbi:MAG: hypothetical protein ACREL3_12690 [Gemmatimonadales bacterium]